MFSRSSSWWHSLQPSFTSWQWWVPAAPFTNVPSVKAPTVSRVPNFLQCTNVGRNERGTSVERPGRCGPSCRSVSQDVIRTSEVSHVLRYSRDNVVNYFKLKLLCMCIQYLHPNSLHVTLWHSALQYLMLVSLDKQEPSLTDQAPYRSAILVQCSGSMEFNVCRHMWYCNSVTRTMDARYSDYPQCYSRSALVYPAAIHQIFCAWTVSKCCCMHLSKPGGLWPSAG